MPRIPGHRGRGHSHSEGRVAHTGDRNPSSELRSLALGRPLHGKYPALVSSAQAGRSDKVVVLDKPSLVYAQAGELAGIPRWQNDASPDERETRILTVLSRMKSLGLLSRASLESELTVPFASDDASKRLSIGAAGSIIAHVHDTESHQLAEEIQVVRSQLELPSLGEIEEFNVVIGKIGRSKVTEMNGLSEISSQLPELVPLMPMGMAVDLHPTAVLHRSQR